MANVNELNFNQLATILNQIVSQATGVATITPTNTAEFVSVGQTALKVGTDPLFATISQVLGRTFFANRPYSRKFRGLEATQQRWGHITRKISIADNNFEDSAAFDLTDGQSVDMYAVKKSKLLQENFYGENMFSDHITIPSVQLETAFQSPEQFQQLLDLMTTNMQDRMEQAAENFARATIANKIGAIVTVDNANQVVNLLTEYNAETGQTLTAQTVRLPANWPNFVRWTYARIAAISARLTERTSLYHTNVTGRTVQRHTPYEDQRLYLFSDDRYNFEATVLADTFHDNYLKLAYTETVNFWQDIQTPRQVQVTPGYLAADGTVGTGEAVTVNNVMGIIADRDAMGIVDFGRRMYATPFNARGEYYNLWYHQNIRSYSSDTENAVLLLLA